MKRDLVSLADLSTDDLHAILKKASHLKASHRHGHELAGKNLALLFQKPSLRTKVSFDIAMTQLGGHSVYMAPDEVGMGNREATEDVARVLSRYVDAIAARTFSHREIEVLAAHASVPVVNALSNAEHPCQALADLMAIQEKKGTLKGQIIAYVGDGNNVAASLALGAAMTGAHYRIASPQGYGLPATVIARASACARASGATLQELRRPEDAVHGADVVYTDVWASMGQENEAEQRRIHFASYQVTLDLLAQAKSDAIFLHPLPAHRGEEVAPGVLEHRQSAVYDQAENRLHVQKALLLFLLAPARS